MKTNRVLLISLIVCTETFLLFVPVQILSQTSEKHLIRTDEIQDAADLRQYFWWLKDRITAPDPFPAKNNFPPSRTICNGSGHFSCIHHIVNGEDRYDVGATATDGPGCPKAFEKFLWDINGRDKGGGGCYQLGYVALRKNTIFPLFGSLYCLDNPVKEPSYQYPTSAFRIADSDVPQGITLQRRSIILSIYEESGLFRFRSSCCDYDRQYVYIIDYSPPSNLQEGPRVKITDNLNTPEEQKSRYEEFYKKPFPGVKVNWYKVGDIVPFTTVSHKVINIVLPDKEDCRIVHRKNKDGSITELKCRLAGWVELDPAAIPLSR